MITIDYAGEYRHELEVALEASRRAAEVILEFYDAESAATYIKGDGSPVTDADLASDKVIRETITTAFPGDAMLTEEGAQNLDRIANPRCWIVDPIDGTAQYVASTGLFDVMIALCVDGRPAVAVTIHPVSGRIQAAVAGSGAWELIGDVVTRFELSPPQTPPRIVSSKWFGAREAERRAAVERIAERLDAATPPVLEVGFQSRAFSEVNRTYDAFIGLPADTKTSIAQEWDLACVDLITNEAGGAFTDCWGRLHRYNKLSTNISGGILASANAGLHQQLLVAIAPELPEHAPAPDPADDGIGV